MKRTTIAVVLALGLIGLGATGCFNPFRPRVGTGVAIPEPPPRPTSPAGVLKLLRWCWVNRSIGEYEELFTDDFEFAFTDVEAIDNPPIRRDEEIDIARRLFVDGAANEPRAKRIELEFGDALTPSPDSRPGKIDPWHKQINTRVVLRAELADGTWDVAGDVVFYLVRGDSARLPQVLIDRGFKKDSGRWYIERWEDKTSAGSGVVANPPIDTRARAAPRAPVARAASSPAPAATAADPVIHATWGDLMRLFR